MEAKEAWQVLLKMPGARHGVHVICGRQPLKRLFTGKVDYMITFSSLLASCSGAIGPLVVGTLSHVFGPGGGASTQALRT